MGLLASLRNSSAQFAKKEVAKGLAEAKLYGPAAFRGALALIALLTAFSLLVVSSVLALNYMLPPVVSCLLVGAFFAATSALFARLAYLKFKEIKPEPELPNFVD